MNAFRLRLADPAHRKKALAELAAAAAPHRGPQRRARAMAKAAGCSERAMYRWAGDDPAIEKIKEG